MIANWTRIGDLIAGILHKVYVEDLEKFKSVAVDRGLTLEELAGAAIAAAVRERLEAA
jgi:hypothetical protein